SPFAANLALDAGIVDPTGKFFFGASSTQLSAFSISTQGVLNPLPTAAAPPSGGVSDLTMTIVSIPSGSFLYVTNGSIFGFRIDTATGALTSLANPLVAASVNSVDSRALAASGNSLYSINFLPRTVSGFMVNQDGTLTALPGSPFALDLSTSA